MFDVTRLIWRRWAGLQPTGIDRVCLAYLNHFADRSQAVLHYRRFRRILDASSSRSLFKLLADPGSNFRTDFVRQMIKTGLKLDCSGRGRLYLNIGHTGLNDPRFHKWVKSADVRPVYFVHDLIPLTHPEFCRAGERDKHDRRMRAVLSTAAGVIGNSRATIDDLSEFAQSTNQENPPAVVAWLGTDVRARPKAETSTPARPTFVTVGTIEARKNHLLLLHVWNRIVERLGIDAPRLIVVGKRGWECEQVVDMLERNVTLRGFVEEISHCDDQSLASHLASARALLFPSLAEGYGLPLIEALALGTPVIASDLRAFREIGQGVPDLLDPIDGPGWERAILDYAEESSPARLAQRRRISGFQIPTWDDHFAVVEPWLTQL